MADMSVKTKRRGCIFGSIIVVILLLLLGAVVSYFDKDNIWARSHKDLNEVAIACTYTDVPAAAVYSNESGTHKTILFNTSGSLNRWNNDLPVNWISENTSKTELVACIGDEETFTIETCKYTGGPPITRYQHRRVVYIVNAKTGEEIGHEVLFGSVPEACPYTTLKDKTSISGTVVALSEIQNWLAEYVDSSPIAVQTPTLTSFVSPSLTSTVTVLPTSVNIPASTASLSPVEVTFDTIGDYPTGQVVIFVGRIASISSTTCSLQTCSLLLENPAKPSQKMTIFVTVGSNPNQMKPLLDNYTKSDIQVYLNDGSVAVVNYRIRVTGKVCTTSSDEPCISDIDRIELFQVK
jgi:hypothetical protein